MSAAGEDRGTKRGNNETRTTNRPSQPTKDANQIKKTGRTGNNIQNLTSKTPESPSVANLTFQEEHVPLKGFNATEIGNLLKRGFDPKAPTYKPEVQKSGSAWGTKMGAMANGKDFWLELRKQVAALQQTGGVSQGG